MLLDMTLRSSHPTAAERGKAAAHQPQMHRCDFLGISMGVLEQNLFPGPVGVARGPLLFQHGMDSGMAGEPGRRFVCVAQQTHRATRKKSL